MRVNVCSKEIKLTEGIVKYTQDSFRKLEKYLDSQYKAKVIVTGRDEKIKVEVTIIQPNEPIVRTEEIKEDIYIAIDSVYQKLYKKLQKYNIRKKEKSQNREVTEYILAEEIKKDEIVIERVKKINLKPMSVEEAILQMELIGHEFYMFRAEETFEINIVYKRKSGGYGIIEHE